MPEGEYYFEMGPAVWTDGKRWFIGDGTDNDDAVEIDGASFVMAVGRIWNLVKKSDEPTSA